MTIQTLRKQPEPATPVAFSLGVYCGSRPGLGTLYTDTARAVGQWIGERGGQLVYGGGKSGMMGVVAQATQEAGGRVVGVIPHALVDKEHANLLCDELYVVDTMHERKALMAERAQAFLAIPGGIGTLEELFEVWTWRQLGYHDKPTGILNVGGYYDAMLAFLRHSVSQGLMNDWQIDLVQVGTDLQTLLPSLIENAGLSRVSAVQQVA
ncbi:MAG: Cytokinin riboside 5'-monophosphate phosphoribohydrolase [Paracidovorax wautersii]|uniref:Cytokinin riboside 5'-monophosphate phosphoribohydrolase n=1 Tax=Paracidovorax wautersii TaxID=1177982 RepID=A0A7V8FQU1_9BURK|nr:MAG: Cytokinin riboside 5'-monophosphate phosphoribohydrolase [Paracidovorax wautersii]